MGRHGDTASVLSEGLVDSISIRDHRFRWEQPEPFDFSCPYLLEYVNLVPMNVPFRRLLYFVLMRAYAAVTAKP